MLVLSGALPLVFNGLYYLLATPRWDNIELLVGYDALFLIPGIALLSGAWRGTWVLDEERIVFQPRRGRPRSLDWSGVERVLWRTIPRLKGLGVTITLTWVRFSASERREALGFVESKLSASFDLKPVEPIKPGTPVRLELSDPHIGAMAFLFALVALASSAMMVAIVFVPWPAVSPLLRILRPLLVLLLAFWAYFVGLFLWAEEQRREPWKRMLRQIHPAWPWRLRRDVVISRAKKESADPVLDDWSA